MGFDNECILNIQSLPGEYFCPVCRTLVYPNEALQTQCTHLYCKPCLAYVVATTRACPYDGYLVTEADAKPLAESNKAIADAIEKIQVHCLYHRSGCQWQGSLSECTTHCTSCSSGNSPVVCNRCGTQIIHRQVQEHAQICPGVQPQAQQTGTAQVPASAEQNQPNQATSQSSQQASMQTNPGAVSSLPSAPSNAVVSAPAALPATLPAAAPAAVAGQSTMIAQQQVAAQVPTPEQWYQQQQQQQQQQLQYQQYYQQYPGYDLYQQHAQYQQQAYPQYPQANMQSLQQATQVAQQPPAYAQPQPLPQSQALPQQAQSQQMQPQPLTQPQMQGQPQNQAHPYGHTMQMQVPINAQQSLATGQQPQPQMQHQANQASQLHMVTQQAGHLPQTHPPTQALQMQTVVHPQHQQLLPQQHPPQLQQTPTHPQHQLQSQPQSIPRPQLQQYPQMPSQQHPHIHPQPQNLHQTHPPAQPMPQQPATHPVTGHQSYPQLQQQQQILPGPPQQRPAYTQPPQHSLMVHSQPLPQQPQMRPPQMHVGAQVQQAAVPPSQIGQHPNQPPVQQQVQQYTGTYPPAQHLGSAPQMGRPQVHAQHGHIPSHSTGLPHASHPQGIPHVQQYPPTHAQMQQSAPVTQGMTALQSQTMLPSGAHGTLAGESPAPSRLGASEPTDKYIRGSDGKWPSSGPTAASNMAELSRPTIQKQEGDFKKQDAGDNGAGDVSKDNRADLSASRVKEEHAGKTSEQSEGVSQEIIDSDENKSGEKQSQVIGEDVNTERATNTTTEGELDNAPMPPMKSATNTAPTHEVAGQTSIQLGGPGTHPLPSNQDKSSSSFPYSDTAKGEPRLPAPPISEKYPSQMVPHGSLESQHVPPLRPSGPDRVPPQHIPHPGPDHDRRFQGPQSYSMPPLWQAHMRPPSQSFVEHMPPFHPDHPGSGFSDPGLHRGSSQLVPQKMFEPPPHGHLPSSHAIGPRMHAGPLPGPIGGPHGSFDSNEAMLARGPPSFHDGQMNMPHPPYPMQEDKFSTKMPGSYDSWQSDLRPPFPMEHAPPGSYPAPLPSMMKLNGAPGNLPDSLPHGPAGDRFRGLPEERYNSFSDEGFKPLSDERFRSFPVDPARRRREFEEDLKQFPRHPISDGEGVSRFDNYPSRPLDRGPHSWGLDGGSRPFDKVTKPFGADGEPKFDASSGAMAPRMFPPFPSEGTFGDRHLRTDIHQRFEGGSAPGPIQSRFKDFSGRDQHTFGERSRPSGLHQIESFGNAVHGSKFPMPSAPFDASETSRMIEQFGSGNPKIGELDSPNFMAGKPRIGEPFGNHRPGVGSGSPKGFHGHSRIDELGRFGILPPHLRNRESGFSKESGPFGSDDFYSSDPSQKRIAGSAGWCRICKIDCDTVEGLDLHSQTREHQKVAMDIVRNIKKNSSKKHKPSENSSFDDVNMLRMSSFDGRGNRM